MSNDWDTIYTCKNCGTEDVVLPSGPTNSPILIIGAFPGDEEIKHGKPMVGANGGILRTELGKNSIDMKRLRITNLWLHADNKNAGCLAIGAKAAIGEARGKKAILLIGAETVKYFCSCSVEDYNGLLVKSDFLSAPVIMACIQPASVFHGSHGEFKLSISKFAREVERLGLL
jgi:hypothetical protein